jgi:hypothetical protein
MKHLNYIAATASFCVLAASNPIDSKLTVIPQIITFSKLQKRDFEATFSAFSDSACGSNVESATIGAPNCAFVNVENGAGFSFNISTTSTGAYTASFYSNNDCSGDPDVTNAFTG